MNHAASAQYVCRLLEEIFSMQIMAVIITGQLGHRDFSALMMCFHPGSRSRWSIFLHCVTVDVQDARLKTKTDRGWKKEGGEERKARQQTEGEKQSQLKEKGGFRGKIRRNEKVIECDRPRGGGKRRTGRRRRTDKKRQKTKGLKGQKTEQTQVNAVKASGRQTLGG